MSARPIDDAEESSEVLWILHEEWTNERETQAELEAEVDDTEEERRHRGRQKALQQGIRRIEAMNVEDSPYGVADAIGRRLHQRTLELERLIAEGAPLEEKHREIHSQIVDMLEDISEAGDRINELSDEELRPDPEARLAEWREATDGDE